MIELIITAIVFLAIGILIGFKIKPQKDLSFYVEKSQVDVLQEKIHTLEAQIQAINSEKQKLLENLTSKESTIVSLTAEKSTLQEKVNHLTERLSEQKKEISTLQEQLKTEFENIAQKILKENTKELKTVGQENLKNLLEPVEKKFSDFEKKITETHQQNLQDRARLQQQLENLKELNMQLAKDAENLAKALRHDAKKQGNWGEFILERLLENSGLEKGKEYEIQYSDKNAQGDTIRPDVIIYLPENKHLIIDAKVSLSAFQNYISAETEEEKQLALKKHIESIKTHIKELGEKNYSSAKNLHPPDFVLLFTPSEAAFSVALNAEPTLYNYAWDKKIVIVSPTTLLATLRTVASIWRNEKQIQNATEIGRIAGQLYDKVNRFLEDMEKIKKNIENALSAHDNAMNKLTQGRGNIVRTAEKLKTLGAKTHKQINQKYLD